MTVKQAAALDRATTRAREQGIRLLAESHGPNLSTYAVSSGSRPGHWHTVVAKRGARELACTCEAGVHGLVCLHRGFIHDLLVQRANEYRAAAAKTARQSAKTTPRLRNDIRPVGLYK